MAYFERSTVIEETERIIETLVANFPDFATSGGFLKKGGYLSVFSIPNAMLGFISCVGSIVPPEKWQDYARNSQEKGIRLLTTHQELGHLTSYESRDPDNNKWGGAVYADKYIFSFSGLPELADEAIMLTLAVELDFLSLQNASDIAKRNNNPIFDSLAEYMYGQ